MKRSPPQKERVVRLAGPTDRLLFWDTSKPSIQWDPEEETAGIKLKGSIKDRKSLAWE